MNMKNVTLILALLVICIGTVIAAGGGEKDADQETVAGDLSDYLNPKGLPVVSKPITLRFFAPKSQYHDSYENLPVVKELEKRTGIHIEWDEISDWDGQKDKINLRLVTGEIPDVFFRCKEIDSIMLAKYGGDGTFIPLNNLLDQYAPNFNGWLQKFPSIGKGIKTPDGNIYSLCYIIGDPLINVSRKMFINQKWIENVGGKMPSTTDELYDLLTLFKEKDANNNGDPNDEIPLGVGEMKTLMYVMQGFWGLCNRGAVRHKYIGYDEERKELRFEPATERYRDLMGYLNKLYTEGLLDQEYFTQAKTQFRSKCSNDRYGVILTADIAAEVTDFDRDRNRFDFVGIPEALIGPYGDQVHSAVGTPLATPGCFVVTKANKYPEATIRWVDHLYSEDGIKLIFMGFEGETCKELPSGKYAYTDKILNSSLGFTKAIGQYSFWVGGANPSVVHPNYFYGENNPVSEDAAIKALPFTPKDPWPYFTYTEEEAEKMSTLESDIISYVDQMRMMFVTGQVSLENWDKYITQLKKYNLDEYIKIYSAAVQRYLSN